MGYRKIVFEGVSWIGIFRVISRGISFIKIIILGRVLTPSQFGIFGIAQLIVVLFDILSETGIQVFLIQEKKIENYLDTAWVVSILRGAVIGICIFLLSPFIGTYFNSPDSIELLRFISIVPVIKGFANPAIVELQKNLQFQKEFIYRTIIFAFDACSAVLFTLLLQNSIGIVYGLIVGAVAETVLSYVYTPMRPHFKLHAGQLGTIVHRGKWVTISSIFNYVFHNGDNVVVGKLLGASHLGLYQMAYSLSFTPISEITDVFSKVVFPLYVTVANDLKRLRLLFIKITVVTTLLAFPLMLILYIYPELIVGLLLGSKWLQIVPALRILAVFGFIRAVIGCCYPLFLSVKKQQYVTVCMGVSSVGLLVSIVPLVYSFGLVGASYAVLLGIICSIPCAGYFVYKVFN